MIIQRWDDVIDVYAAWAEATPVAQTVELSSRVKAAMSAAQKLATECMTVRPPVLDTLKRKAIAAAPSKRLQPLGQEPSVTSSITVVSGHNPMGIGASWRLPELNDWEKEEVDVEKKHRLKMLATLPQRHSHETLTAPVTVNFLGTIVLAKPTELKRSRTSVFPCVIIVIAIDCDESCVVNLHALACREQVSSSDSTIKAVKFNCSYRCEERSHEVQCCWDAARTP